MQFLLLFERRLTQVATALAVLLMALVVGLAFYQVVARFVFGTPAIWSEVAARSAMIWMVFCGLSVAFRHGSMIAVDFVQDVSPPAIKRVLLVLTTAAALVFLFILVWFGWGMAQRVASQRIAGLGISIAWIYAALPVGAAMATPAVIVRMFEAIAETRGKRGALKDVEGMV